LRKSPTLRCVCRIDGRERWIPRNKIREGTTIANVGDNGTLVLARQFAMEWGLVPYDG
jgi:hypothetical protein